MLRARVLACLALATASIGVAAVSCARSEQSPAPVPPVDASIDDAAIDPSHDPLLDALIEEGSSDADASEASDAPTEAQDLCSQDGSLWFDAQTEASSGPCQPGLVEKEWCGQCGRRQRTCNTDSTWKAWSDCFEDEAAECIPCETHTVGCGLCGTRSQRCDITQNVCRWVLGACDAKGECSPGDYQTDGAGCAQGLAHVRWCQPGCSWSASGACEAPPSFQPIASPPLAGRVAAASVQTPAGWLIWGGVGASGALDDGAVFDPTGNVWTVMAPAQWPSSDPEAGLSSLSARASPIALWIGDSVLLWGGDAGNGTNDVLGDGARWSAGSGWSGVSTTDQPSPRSGASAVWDPADGYVIAWGGRTAFGGPAKGGARYHAATDSWKAIADGPLQARRGHSAVWDPVHARMIVWGGISDASSFPERGGAAYDPATDTWTPIPDAPIRRKDHVAFWDASHGRMLVLFGEDGVWPGPRSDGAAWEPSTSTWSLVSDASISGYPIATGYAAAFGDGKVWVVGGNGEGDGKLTLRGARYDPATDAWSRLADTLVARTGHTAAWLDGLLVWGGQAPQSQWLTTGERLRNMK